MNLLDIFQRDLEPQAWVEDHKIPWGEPEFSRRALREHLSQDHDAASRRMSLIKKHVDWIHNEVLDGKPARILDLACGPGLYTTLLAMLGHASVGIDISPASIEYAVKHAPENCTYSLGDIRNADFDSGFDLVMLIFGGFNLFKVEDAKQILEKAKAALNPGGKLLLEVNKFDAVYDTGNYPANWYSAENDLFADEPHLCLSDSYWNDELSVAIERYFIVNPVTGGVTRYTDCMQAYEDDAYQNLLKDAGFNSIQDYPSLAGEEDIQQADLKVLMARR